MRLLLAITLSSDHKSFPPASEHKKRTFLCTVRTQRRTETRTAVRTLIERFHQSSRRRAETYNWLRVVRPAHTHTHTSVHSGRIGFHIGIAKWCTPRRLSSRRLALVSPPCVWWQRLDAYLVGAKRSTHPFAAVTGRSMLCVCMRWGRVLPLLHRHVTADIGGEARVVHGAHRRRCHREAFNWNSMSCNYMYLSC